MLTEYSEDFEDWSEVCVTRTARLWLSTSKTAGATATDGISKCSPTDAFDEDTGMAVAFAHFRNYPIPNFI